MRAEYSCASQPVPLDMKYSDQHLLRLKKRAGLRLRWLRSPRVFQSLLSWWAGFGDAQRTASLVSSEVYKLRLLRLLIEQRLGCPVKATHEQLEGTLP